MKVTLTDWVHQGTEQTRHPIVQSVDFAARVVWLPDGRWVPFERIIVGDKDVSLAARTEPEKASDIAEQTPMRQAAAKMITHTRSGHVCHLCICGLPFPTPLALSNHRRTCKGASA